MTEEGDECEVNEKRKEVTRTNGIDVGFDVGSLTIVSLRREINLTSSMVTVVLLACRANSWRSTAAVSVWRYTKSPRSEIVRFENVGPSDFSSAQITYMTEQRPIKIPPPAAARGQCMQSHWWGSGCCAVQSMFFGVTVYSTVQDRTGLSS